MKRLLQSGLLSLGLLSLGLTLGAGRAMAQPAVMVENYRNDNCGNCRIPDIEFEQWIEENKSTYKVDILYLHNEITDPQDPFFLESRGDVSFRGGTNFYNVMSNPRIFVQGYDVGTVINDWKTAVAVAAAQPKQATVTITDMVALGNNKYSFKATATNASGKQVRLYAALNESGIIYDNPKAYQNPPSGVWDNIFRKMLPDRDGSTDFGATGEQTFTFDLTGKSWDLSKMKATVFVQASQPVSGTREIYGHTVVDLSPLASTGRVDAVAPLGFSIKSLANPFSVSTPIEVHLGQFGHLRLEMFDMTGKQLSTIVDNSLSEGAYEFNVGKDLLAGTYLVNAFVDGNFAGQVKLVKN